MKYGNPALHFNNPINPSARRKEGMGLKKAQPGAPYGWTRTGEPYCGTQYEVDIDGKRWNSLSTRDGHRDNWRTFASVTTKVAQSAYESTAKRDAFKRSVHPKKVARLSKEEPHELLAVHDSITDAAKAVKQGNKTTVPQQTATR